MPVHIIRLLTDEPRKNRWKSKVIIRSKMNISTSTHGAKFCPTPVTTTSSSPGLLSEFDRSQYGLVFFPIWYCTRRKRGRTYVGKRGGGYPQADFPASKSPSLKQFSDHPIKKDIRIFFYFTLSLKGKK